MTKNSTTEKNLKVTNNVLRLVPRNSEPSGLSGEEMTLLATWKTIFDDDDKRYLLAIMKRTAARQEVFSNLRLIGGAA